MVEEACSGVCGGVCEILGFLGFGCNLVFFCIICYIILNKLI